MRGQGREDGSRGSRGWSRDLSLRELEGDIVPAVDALTDMGTDRGNGRRRSVEQRTTDLIEWKGAVNIMSIMGGGIGWSGRVGSKEG